MIQETKDIALSIVNAKDKTRIPFPGPGTINDIIRFGFSFVESEDNFVAYVLAHPDRMKEILCGFQDAILDPDRDGIGRLWTAKLIATRKFKENQIVFANQELGVILILDIPNPNKMWED